MKKYIKHLLPISLFLFLLVIALSVGYYFIFALPRIQRDKLKLEQQKFELQSSEDKYQECSQTAINQAIELLKSKMEMEEKLNGKGTKQYIEWQVGYDKGLYLREDYNNYYKRCLNSYGLDVPN